MDPLFDSTPPRPALAVLTNRPSVRTAGLSVQSQTKSVVAEIRKAVRAYQSRRVSAIAEIGEYSEIEAISDRPEAQVCLAREMGRGQRLFVVKKRPVSLAPKNEVDALTRVHKHTNIVDFYGSEIAEDYVYIFMEYPATGYAPLGRVMQGQRLDEYATVKISKGLLEGLSHVHRCQVLHGDLKPANILVDGNTMHVKLIDFGAAALADGNSVSGRVFEDMRGTVQYAAPEILRGEKYGFNADCWSFGCVVTEIFSGDPPFGVFDNPLAATFAILQTKQTPLDAVATHKVYQSGWSPLFRNFLRTVLVRDCEKRPHADSLLTHPWIYLPLPH